MAFPKLKIGKPARKRSDYTSRTRQSSRAAQSLIAAVNGTAPQSWDRDAIRSALLRQVTVEVDQLLEDLPRPAISYAIGKGWIHRLSGEGWFRVTRRAASDLSLPAKNASGATIRFLDATKLPKSLPAFVETVAQKPTITEARAAAIIADLALPRGLLAQAQAYKSALDETGWAAIEIARRSHPGDTAEINRAWNDVIYHVNLLTIEPEYQAAAAAGHLSLKQAYELFRVDPAFRSRLFEGFKSGWSAKMVRRLSRKLVNPNPQNGDPNSNASPATPAPAFTGNGKTAAILRARPKIGPSS